MSQPYEVSYWSKKFKVTPARLKAAVAAVGHSSKNVGAYLTGSKKSAKKTPKKASKKTVKKTAKKRAKKKAA
jgi:predicted nucleic acid-binding Zn ribbon protein